MTDRKPWKTVQTFGALLGVSVAVLVFVFILIRMFADPPVMWDLDVYRGAVRSWLSGNGLYEFTLYGPGGEVLPFTYPPFAAILMAPLAVLPDGVVNLTWMAGTLVLCVALSVILLRSAPGAGRRLTLRAAIVGVLASLALLVSEPVSHGASLGQVSLFLLLVSFTDAGGFVPPKWRGWLVGLAGAMKLIPLVFVPYYLVTRQWRAARNAGLGFVAATALGFAVLPSESVRYWTVLVFDTSRIGDVQASRNKSLLGLVVRWNLGGDQQRLLWLALAAVIAAVALWRARRHYLRGEEVAAALVVGVLSIVLTPLSWPHHQCWVPVTALYLLLLRRPWPMLAGVLLLLGFVAGTPLISWDETGPLWVRLAWELPSLVCILIALLGLPRKLRFAAGSDTPVFTGLPAPVQGEPAS